jgi:uncharacterized protein YdaU (DUF1376 family)
MTQTIRESGSVWHKPCRQLQEQKSNFARLPSQVGLFFPTVAWTLLMSDSLEIFPLIIDKWIAGTRYLTLEERGAYFELIIYLFTQKRPIKDGNHVARILGTDPRVGRKLWAKLCDKFDHNQHGSTHQLVTRLLKNKGRIKGLSKVALDSGSPAQGIGIEIEEEKSNKKEEKPAEKKAQETAFTPPQEINPEAWADLDQYRTTHKTKKVRETWTNLAKAKACNLLSPLSHPDQQRCVDMTIANGWQGIFPGKLRSGGNGAQAHQPTLAQQRSKLHHDTYEKVAREAADAESKMDSGDL